MNEFYFEENEKLKKLKNIFVFFFFLVRFHEEFINNNLKMNSFFFTKLQFNEISNEKK